VAAELMRVRKKHGPTSIFGGSYGWKSPGKLHNCQTLLARALTVNGGFVSRSGDYSTGAAQVILPYVVGSIDVYEQPTAWPVLAEHTELMVFWRPIRWSRTRSVGRCLTMAPILAWKH
jgi:trimethylamine-N-oxide reductase (cytochrome c)